MIAKRRRRPSAFGLILLLLLLALGTAGILAYTNRPKPGNVSLPTPAPSPMLSPSPTLVAEQEALNPVASVLEGFETVWAHSFEQFEAVALRQVNKAPLNKARLLLTFAHADVMLPAKKLQALSKSGTDHWMGESAEKNPLPAFITGSGETYTFGINVSDIAPNDQQEQDSSKSPVPSLVPNPTPKPTLAPTPVPQIGYKLIGRCEIHKNKLAYSVSTDDNLGCIVELIQTGAGYIGQIYRPSGAGKGVIRFNIQLSLISCAFFPYMEKKEFISIYEDVVSWEQLCQGADQVMTCTNGTAELVIGDSAQQYR